jgi:hypothetical protein
MSINYMLLLQYKEFLELRKNTPIIVNKNLKHTSSKIPCQISVTA